MNILIRHTYLAFIRDKKSISEILKPLPVFSFSDDGDTGFYHTTNNTIKVSIGVPIKIMEAVNYHILRDFLKDFVYAK
jgi:hypothetical protein